MFDRAGKIDDADLLLVICESIPSVRLSEFFRRMWKWSAQTNGRLRGTRVAFIFFGEYDPRPMLELPDHRRYMSYLRMMNVGYLWVRRKASLQPRIFVRDLIDDLQRDERNKLAETF